MKKMQRIVLMDKKIYVTKLSVERTEILKSLLQDHKTIRELSSDLTLHRTNLYDYLRELISIGLVESYDKESNFRGNPLCKVYKLTHKAEKELLK